MTKLLAFLIAEITRITIERLGNAGKFTNLTEDEAKQIIAQIDSTLQSALPSPTDLEQAT
jgi:hypothetical protein